VLHIHANIDSSKQIKKDAEHSTKTKGPFKYPEWDEWTKYAIATIQKLLCEVKERQWLVKFIHLEHVKSYAPHVDHVVLDLDCRPV
jgi:tRNA wybutosine-synthesizing protein 2